MDSVSRFPQGSGPRENGLHISTNVERDPVYLRGRVQSSVTFACMMLTLGRVVQLDMRRPVRDHSRYQHWVAGKYLEELASGPSAPLLDQFVELTSRRDKLAGQLTDADAELAALRRQILDTRRSERAGAVAAQRRFWDWLYQHDREAWWVLDPLVSVLPGRVFFEAFSQDESAYTRVTVPLEGIDVVDTPTTGTTNIDFSNDLERALARVRSYRPVDIVVGQSSVDTTIGASTVIERRIELPDSWVTGLLQVQSAAVLATETVSLDPGQLAAALRWLRRHRDRPDAPRALLIHLEPGLPASVSVEPWMRTFAGRGTPYPGTTPHTFRVWGRRRLALLEPLLDLDAHVQVRLASDGLPSFWEIEADGIRIELALTGWSRLDWAARTRFSALLPAMPISRDVVAQVGQLLRERHSMSRADVDAATGLSTAESSGALVALCRGGHALYEANTNLFWARELFPDSRSATVPDDPEEAAGIALAHSGAVTITATSGSERGHRELHAVVVDTQGKAVPARLTLDVNGRMRTATCTCRRFRHDRLVHGPCRHVVALIVTSGDLT